ncbi:hypothetical protein HNY73_013201 [Argiope bruennichi]|uniref:Uncharacterized protein n=1 Tax=Argiope bruennichi TaxID=94029 RepID=A0A8T0F232_ARGBR|nr:hypothetical protein HNY73_013201 [Argiope bruennichi]
MLKNNGRIEIGQVGNPFPWQQHSPLRMLTTLPSQPMMESNEAEVDAKPEVCSATVMVMGVGKGVELEPDLHILQQRRRESKQVVVLPLQVWMGSSIPPSKSFYFSIKIHRSCAFCVPHFI